MPRLLVAFVAVLVLGLPASAQAVAPDCQPGDVNETSLEDLTFNDMKRDATFGRTDPHTVYVGWSEGRDPAEVTAEPTTGTPLTRPSTLSVQQPDASSNAFPELPVLIYPGESARVRVTGTYQTFRRPDTNVCRVTLLSSPLQGRPASVPRLKAGHPRKASLIPWDELRFDLAGQDRCADAPGLVATFRVAGHDKPLRISAPKSCKFPSRSWVGAAGMRATTNEGHDITFRPVSHAKRALTVAWTMAYGTRAVASGSMRVQFGRQAGIPTRRIYDSSFDEYINICINHNHQLHARHGQLYCVIPGQPGYWYSVISRLRTRPAAAS